MFSTPTLIILGICAVAIVLLAIRYMHRRRRERPEGDLLESQQPTPMTDSSAAQETPEQQSVAPEQTPAPAPAPLPSAEPALASAASSIAVPSVAARSAGGVSWKDRRLFEKTTRFQEPEINDVPVVEPHDLPTADTSDHVFGAITPLLSASLPDTDARIDTAKRELQTAGYYNPHALQNLNALRYVAIVAAIVFFGGLLIVVPPQLETTAIVLLLVFALAGWALPGLFVKMRAAERTSEIERSLPDMLDMLNMCVSQGLTVNQSFKRIGRDLSPVYPALSKELSIVSQQADVGSMQVALDNFSKRIDVPEVTSFTTFISQTERMGTSVSAALADYSDNMRASLSQRADEKANQATFKLLFPTVVCLMPAVYIFLLGPAIVELSDFFTGGGIDSIQQSQNALQQLNQ